MTTIRQQRVAQMLYQELSILIAHELDDPRLSLIQVTDVDVSRDLRNVKIYVSHDDDEVSKHEVLRGLRQATPYLRRQIAMRCTLRAVPDLVYAYDETPQKAARIDSLLNQIAAERESENRDASTTDTRSSEDAASDAPSISAPSTALPSAPPNGPMDDSETGTNAGHAS